METAGLVRRLREVPRAELAGAHLVLEAGGKEVLLSAASVDQVVRVVALQPVGGGAAAVAGSFTFRGQSLIAFELAALLEGRGASTFHLDAHLVVLACAAPLALLVDRVQAVVSGVTFVVDERRAPSPPVVGERRSQQLGRLVARVGPRVMPLLEAHELSSLLQGRAP